MCVLQPHEKQIHLSSHADAPITHNPSFLSGHVGRLFNGVPLSAYDPLFPLVAGIAQVADRQMDGLCGPLTLCAVGKRKMEGTHTRCARNRLPRVFLIA